MYHYSWFELVLDSGLGDALSSLHLNKDEETTLLTSWTIALGLIGFALLGRMALTRARARGGTMQYLADPTLTARNACELYTDAMRGLAFDILGEDDGRRFFALVGGLFIYVLSSNLVGLLPGLGAPSANFSNNLAMAITVVLVFNVAGLARNGFAYVKHLFGPVWYLAILMFPLETLTLLVVRPFSLSMRLMGNMFGDHMVFGIMSGLIPVVYPCVFLGLGIFVSFIQALVFTLLSSIYIALAVAHEEEESHAH